MGDGTVVETKLTCEPGVHEGNDNANCAGGRDLPSEVDVLVVGCGPVGAAIGALLGRDGVRVLVVDRAAEIFMAPRAIALDNDALRILQYVGVN